MPQQNIPITIPTGGMNRKDPLPNMDPIYSPWLLNVNCENQSVDVRPGYVVFGQPAEGKIVLGLGTWGNSSGVSGVNKLFAVVQETSVNKIYDIGTGTFSVSRTCAAKTADEYYSSHFASNMFFAVESDYADCGAYYNGSSWSAWGFTYSGGSIGGRVMVHFKRRPYIFNANYLYYGGLGYLTGATTRVDLSDLFGQDKYVTWAGVLSSPGDRPSEQYLAYGNLSGEILIYAGDYPDSETWNCVARLKTSPPLGYNSVISFLNDIWILTESGVVSLRQLLSSGDSAASQYTVSHLIDPLWIPLMAASRATNWSMPVSGAFWPEQNKIYILCPGHAHEDGSVSTSDASMFICNVSTGAWAYHHLAGVSNVHVGSLTYFQNNLYFVTGDKVMCVDKDGFQDQEQDRGTSHGGGYSLLPGDPFAFDYSIATAYNNFGSANKNKRIHGADLICNTDFDGSNVPVKIQTDMGRETSAAASVVLKSGYNVAQYNVGAVGTYLQLRIEGTTDTDATNGLKVISAGVNIS